MSSLRMGHSKLGVCRPKAQNLTEKCESKSRNFPFCQGLTCQKTIKNRWSEWGSHCAILVFKICSHMIFLNHRSKDTESFHHLFGSKPKESPLSRAKRFRPGKRWDHRVCQRYDKRMGQYLSISKIDGWFTVDICNFLGKMGQNALTAPHFFILRWWPFTLVPSYTLFSLEGRLSNLLTLRSAGRPGCKGAARDCRLRWLESSFTPDLWNNSQKKITLFVLEIVL